MKERLKRNSLFFLNLLILFFLVYGLLQTYGTTYLGGIAVYGGSFVAAYYLADRFGFKQTGSRSFVAVPPRLMNPCLNVLIGFILIFQLLHYLCIVNVPLIKAMLHTDYYYIAQIRQDIKGVGSTLVNYTASFVIKSIIPVLLFLLFWYDRRRFWLTFLISAFYALALMQKAYIVTIVIPLIIGLLMERRWIKAGFFSGIALAGVVLLVLVTNPTLRPYPFGCGKCLSAAPVKETSGSASAEVTAALYERVFITTGEMVGNWFYYVPDSLPFLKDKGYRFAAGLSGGTYRDYSREIYDKIYRKEAAMGFTGTATTAFFMYDYSSFGNYGLLMAGIYLACFLVLIKRFFGADHRTMFALNGLFVIWLSSAAFTTTLLSGGWLLTLLLYLVFKPYYPFYKTGAPDAETAR